MARKTKEQLETQLDAQIIRANRLEIEMARLRGGIQAATELASRGHIDLPGLVEEVQSLLSNYSEPFEVEDLDPPFEPGML